MIKKIASVALAMIMTCICLPVSAQTEENLVAGLSYTVETGEPTTMSYDKFVESGVKFDVDNGQLTDGKFAPDRESSDLWYKAFRSQNRIVTFDLKNNCAINKVKASFLHNKPSGLYAPRYINIYLSDDGENYQTISEYQTNFDLTYNALKRCECEIVLDKTYSARYVKVESQVV